MENESVHANKICFCKTIWKFKLNFKIEIKNRYRTSGPLLSIYAATMPLAYNIRMMFCSLLIQSKP